MAASFTTYGQVGIGTTTPEAVLDVVSTNSGILAPRVVNAAAVTTPINGLIIYDLSLNCFNFYENNAWSGCRTVVPALTISDIVLASDNPAVGGTPSLEDLEAVGIPVEDLTRSQVDYEEAIAIASPAPTTLTQLQAIIDAVNASPQGSVTAIVDVYNPTTGKTWMDRNLGATQAATSSTDSASYGDLYQWGRFTDGHQYRTSSTTSTLATTSTPGHSDFIINSNNYHWLTPQDDTLWQGVNGVNNPCPVGYRIPTETELNNERLSWGSNNAAGAFGSVLKLPISGFRSPSSGAFALVGLYGWYWSSTIGTVAPLKAKHLYFYNNNAHLEENTRASGMSVRCIKN